MLVPKNIFPIVACASRETTRYAINGVLLERTRSEPTDAEPHTARAVVTDGRMMLRVDWAEPDPADFPSAALPESNGRVSGWTVIIPSASWAAAGKRLPCRTIKPILAHLLIAENDGTERTMVDILAVDLDLQPIIQTIQLSKGHFPKYSDVIPEFIPFKPGDDPYKGHSVCVGYNPKLFGTLLSTMAKIVPDTGFAFTVPTSPAKPIRIDGHNETTAVCGVLMPINLR